MNESKGKDPESYRQLAKDVRLNEWLWLIAAPAALLGFELTTVYPEAKECIAVHWLCWSACGVSIVCAAIRSRLIARIYDERAELIEIKQSNDPEPTQVSIAENKSKLKVSWNEKLAVIQVTTLIIAIALFMVGYTEIFPKPKESSSGTANEVPGVDPPHRPAQPPTTP